MAKEIVWQRREAPRLFKFVQKGDSFEGVLMARERITMNGKPVARYTFELASGETVVMLGTTDLVSKVRRDDVGHAFRIKYMGEDVTVKRGDNFMRVFDVEVADAVVTAPVSDGTEITDDDIPF